jgi:hypothetical protein
MLYSIRPLLFNFKIMDDFESKTPTAKKAESVLKGKHPEIFDKFDILRIREAIIQITKEASSLHAETSVDEEHIEQQQEGARDSWVSEEPDDFSDNIIEILESDYKLIEKIKESFYFALVNGHMDRVHQLKDAFSDIDFSDEVADAFNDAHTHNKRYLLKDIAQFHLRLSYEELLAELDSKADGA